MRDGRRIAATILVFLASGCTNAGGCKPPGTPPKTHVDTQLIRNNALQGRLSNAGFEFLETDLMLVVEAALAKPLALKIPKTPIKNPATGNVIVTLCDKPEGCDASMKVIPGTLQLRRLAPDGTGKSKIAVDARVEIEAKELLIIPGDPGYPERDCQIDLRFIDHRKDVCRGDNLSWAKESNTYNASDAEWSKTIEECNAFCAPENAQGDGRALAASMLFGVDESLGFPEATLEDVSVSMGSSTRCPAMNDLRIFHPNRPFTCADGTSDEACQVFEQSILSQVPLTCLSLTFAYNAAVAILLDTLRAASKIIINQQLRQLMAVKCTADAQCQAGATCATIVVSSGFPEGCEADKCLLPAVVDSVCQVEGKVVPPLAGIETELDMGTLDPAYTPDNAGPLKVVAAMGGFAANDPTPEGDSAVTDDTRGLTVGGFFGVESARAGCVAPRPPPETGTIQPLVVPEQVSLWDPVERTMRDQGYHAAFSLHKDAIAMAAHGMYTNGSLCMTFSGTSDFPLNSRILALIVGSLDQIDDGSARPSFMYIFPEEPPAFSIGEGRVHDEAGTLVVDSPHAEMHIKRLRLDFYSMVQQRYVRLFSIAVDFDIGLFLEFNEKNEIVPVTSDLKGGLKNVKVSNSEILADQTKHLEKSLPALLDFALPIVSQALFRGFPLPDSTIVPGYEFKMVGLRGMSPIPNSAPVRYEFISAFGMLARKAPMAARDLPNEPPIPSAKVEALPPTEDGTPRVKLVLASDTADGVEYAYRLNGGIYSMFEPATAVEVARPQLAVAGPHRIDVIARRTNDKQLVSKPYTVSFNQESASNAAATSVSDSSHAGCQSLPDPSPFAALLCLFAVRLIRRRAPR